MSESSILRHINPFLYSEETPWKQRIWGFFGLATTLLAGFGMFRFLSLSKWYFIFFGPIAFIIFFSHSMRYFVRLFYKNFSKKDHLAFIHEYWNTHEEPSVDVFLPWCGEELDIYEETLKGVFNLEYQNKKVYLLDDKGDVGLEYLAEKYNFTYLSRPNKGEWKKSGNLQYGYEHSEGEYVLTLDADFVPIPTALWQTIPYIDTNPTTGILQTPQYFDQTKEKHNQNPIEFGGGNVVENFYNIDQVSRDTFQAAICVGTSAIYRRTAILAVGGTPKVNGTEDVRTGLSITRAGYHVKYIPLIISIGTSPDTLQGYFRQHNRWCNGSIAILFDYFLKAKISKFAKVIYLLNPLYYFGEALAPILTFELIGLLAFQPNTLAVYNSLFFLPKILFELVLIPLVLQNHRPRLGTKLAALNNIFTYIYTIFIDSFSKARTSWHPAGVAINSVSRDFRRVVRVGLVITSTYTILLTAVLIWHRQYLLNIQIALVLMWTLYTAVWYVIYIYYATSFLREHDSKYIHPTSNLKTYYRRIIAEVKHYFLPTITAFLAVTVGFNMYNLHKIRESKIALPSPAPLPVIKAPIIVPPAIPAPYTYVTKKGDNLTDLGGKAIDNYSGNNNLVLDPIQRFYAVFVLISNTNSPKILSVNYVVEFPVADIETAIASAENMSSIKYADIKKYREVNNINYDN